MSATSAQIINDYFCDHFLPFFSTCRNSCSEIYDMLGLGNSTRKNGIRQLDAPVQMSAMNFGVTQDDISAMTSIWMNGSRDERLRHVNQKKLEKAEAKLQQKQDKRNAEGTKPVSMASGQDCQASAAQVISKKSSRLENKAGGRTQDIRIENFDVAYGEK